MKINNHVYLVGSGKMGMDWTAPSDCNVYLLNGGSECALIDTGTGDSVDQILEHVQDSGFSPADLKYILLTHVHADHAGGAASIREKTGASVVVFEDAESVLEEGNEDEIDLTVAKKAGFYPSDYHFRPCKVDMVVKDGAQLSVGSLNVRVVETPGHSRFDLSFIVEDSGGKVHLFSGDTIMYDGKISMLHTRDFNLQSLAASVEKLSKVNGVESLLPGHFQPAVRNGSSHVLKAHDIFEKMGVPPNIV
ncbi:MAG TPA: MBL fold metallo-hydrolase [Bacillales bacterium]